MSLDRALKKLTTGIYIVTTKQELQINGMVASYLDCVLRGQFAPGDHTLFIGEVIEGDVLKDGEPLSSHDLEHVYGGIT